MVDLVRPLSLPRLRLLALWTSQVAHFAGTYTLRVFVVLRLSGEGVILTGSAWHLVTALFMAPSILLGPLHGALANTLPKPLVLRIAALCGVAVGAFFTWFNDGWLSCVVLAAISSASYTPTRLALLPAAAYETGIPHNSVVGAIETGAVLAIIGGMIQGGAIADKTLPGHPDMSAAMVVVSGCICYVWQRSVWCASPATSVVRSRRPRPCRTSSLMPCSSFEARPAEEIC
jgi:hypothetical protein